MKTIKVLKKHEYTCERCKYTWQVVKPDCGPPGGNSQAPDDKQRDDKQRDDKQRDDKQAAKDGAKDGDRNGAKDGDGNGAKDGDKAGAKQDGTQKNGTQKNGNARPNADPREPVGQRPRQLPSPSPAPDAPLPFQPEVLKPKNAVRLIPARPAVHSPTPTVHPVPAPRPRHPYFAEPQARRAAQRRAVVLPRSSARMIGVPARPVRVRRGQDGVTRIYGVLKLRARPQTRPQQVATQDARALNASR